MLSGNHFWQLINHFNLSSDPFGANNDCFFEDAQRKHNIETIRHLAIFGDMVLLLTGEIGAGKSTYSLKIKDEFDAVLFSLDEWFKKLFFEDYNESFELNWTLERLTRCKNCIWLIAEGILNMGMDVVLDLGFQKTSEREELKYLCDKNKIELTAFL